jgi:hypothetical protein
MGHSDLTFWTGKILLTDLFFDNLGIIKEEVRKTASCLEKCAARNGRFWFRPRPQRF